MPERQPLRIVHCFRSPVGGIFRHVRDLISAQAAEGHKIGILCDSTTGGEYEDTLFQDMLPNLSLGLHRIPMRRSIGFSDIAAVWQSYREIRALNPDVLHSHGAKGGAYARLIGALPGLTGSKVARLYCPHGGSIHYDAKTMQGRIYFRLERFLERATDRLIFVSNYEKQGYLDKVGTPRCPYSLVYNGLNSDEFEPVETRDDAADFLFIGMMRDLKGPDVFIEALAIVETTLGRKITAHMVGDGPDKQNYQKIIDKTGSSDRVIFHPAMPARKAFEMARIVVVPSRAESMPYIVLEAIAAAKPLVVTNVGGIPEIYQDQSHQLVEPGNATALADTMIATINDPDSKKTARQQAKILKGRFSVSHMAGAVSNAYQATIKR